MLRVCRPQVLECFCDRARWNCDHRSNGITKNGRYIRFDQNIPQAVAERLREIANIANLVGEFFEGDVHKVGLWFELANPQLGGISPRTMIRAGRYKRLLNFVVEARAAEQAAAEAKAEAQREVASRPVTT